MIQLAFPLQLVWKQEMKSEKQPKTMYLKIENILQLKTEGVLMSW